MRKFSLDEAIKVLRQHNVTGTSVLRITRGQALEKDLLSQVLDSCEQLISEKAEYKRLLKAAVKDIGDMSRYCLGINCDHCPHIHTLSRGYQSCIWQHEKEALKLIGEEDEDNA